MIKMLWGNNSCWLTSKPPVQRVPLLFTCAAAPPSSPSAPPIISKISAYNAAMNSKLSPDIRHEAWTLIMLIRLITLITLIRVISPQFRPISPNIDPLNLGTQS
jgi:hypothetical protein